jgi:hypothetical protein
MFANILILAIVFLINTGILLALLWIMIMLQKLDYHFLGLLGSAALASGLDMIPHFGHMLAVPALYFCIWKVTRSSIFPDAAFTVVISYALKFCVNLFIMGMLMGDLRPADRETGGDETAAPEPAAESQPSAVTQKSVPDAATNSVPTADAKEAEAIAQQFSIKGITRNADKSSLTLQSGKKTYTIFLGQLISVQTDDGPVSVRFTDLGKDWVVLNIRGIQVKCPVHAQ